ICGAFGLGTTWEQDVRGLERLFDALEPGGTLLLDNEAPYSDPGQWRLWMADVRAGLPEQLKPRRERRPAPDGTERELRSRALAADPLAQTITLEIVADLWRDGELVATEARPLTVRLYLDDQLRTMLAAAGFEVVAVHGDYLPLPPTADTNFLI